MATDPHPVVAILKERREARSTPGGRTDSHRVAVAIEGGGMRGVVSAGMLAALEELGFLQAFDDVYGVSAGAINGAAFLSGKSSISLAAYTHELRSRMFFSRGRLLVRRPMLSLDYALDLLLDDPDRGISWRAVVESAIRFHVVATSLHDVRPVRLSGFGTKAELREALRASASIPFIAGPPTAIGDDVFFDGAMTQAIPAGSAIDDGCTHVLTLTTQPQDGAPRRQSRIDVVSRRLRAVDAKLSSTYERRLRAYDDVLASLGRMAVNPGAPHVLTLAPSANARVVRPLERNERRIAEGGRAGHSAVFGVFEPPGVGKPHCG